MQEDNVLSCFLSFQVFKSSAKDSFLTFTTSAWWWTTSLPTLLFFFFWLNFCFCNISKSFFIVNIKQHVSWNLIFGYFVSLIQAARIITLSFFLILAAFCVASHDFLLFKESNFSFFSNRCVIKETLLHYQ